MIESLSNSLIKHASSLKEKKYRNIHCEFLAEGSRLVNDLIEFDFDSIVNIYATEKSVSILKNTAKINIVSDNVMKKLSETDASQDIVAVVKKKKTITIDALISKCKNILYLDRISDPSNLGTIVRTAVAANYALILHNCTDIYAGKVVRGGMGAITKADFCEADLSTIQTLRQHNYTILSSCMNGKNVFEMKKIFPVCIVIGSEAHGVDSQIISLSDEVISIPMANKLESLNASVAAGILAYHFVKF